ncbi:MAG: hypothetical protein ACOCQC_03545 [Halanaerobiaceae bacterium]
MRIYITGMIIFILVFSPVLAAAAPAAEVDFVSHMQRLSNEDGDLSVFSPDARERLEDITSLFNTREGVSENEQLYIPEFELPETFNISGNEEENDLSIRPLDRTLVEASYREDREEMDFESETSLNLEYWMGSNTLLRAGYDQETQQWLEEKGFRMDEDGYFTAPDGEPVYDEKEDDYALREENRQRTNVGVSYQTSDRMTFSADYMAEEPFTEPSSSSTALGVEYTDDLGEVRASYQFGLQEMERQLLTGLELDVRDRATLSASYRNISAEELQERIENESLWDFGVDLNFDELSSLSLGYQMFNASEYSSEEDEEEDSLEEGSYGSSIQAGLQLEF